MPKFPDPGKAPRLSPTLASEFVQDGVTKIGWPSYEVARVLQIQVKTLWEWSTLGYIPRPFTIGGSSGNRYTRRQVDLLKQYWKARIKALQNPNDHRLRAVETRTRNRLKKEWNNGN